MKYPEKIFLGEGYPTFDPNYTREDIDSIKILRSLRNGIAEIIYEDDEYSRDLPKYRLVLEKI